ncbi:MAG: SPASM domain-containing protein [Elusimicrobia bacterium]|nr:SPASM domain-containing protein [Elusimicrobiota bacterium]
MPHKLQPPPTLLRVFSEADIRRARRAGALMGVSLRLPCPCNFSCVYCYSNREELSLYHGEIISFLETAIALGIRSVSIVGEGEPLLYERPVSRGARTRAGLMDLVDFLDRRGIQSIIYTNASLMDRRTAEALYDKNTVIVAKQNSLDPRVQEGLTGRGTHALIQRGLERLKAAGFCRSDSPSRLSLHTVVVKSNLKEIPGLWRLWRQENILPQVQILVPTCRRAEELQVSPGQIRLLFTELSRIDREEFGFGWEPRPPIVPYGCGTVHASCGLRPNGDVSICAYTDIILGNIRKESLPQILAKDATRRLRAIGRNIKGFCRGCRLHRELGCYGCRSHEVASSGDVFASYGFCWRRRR